MQITKRWWITGVLTGGLLMGCGSNSSPTADAGGGTPDTGPSMDDAGMSMDVQTDSSVADHPAADHPAADHPAVDPCATAVDLSAMTPGMDGAIHVMGDNSTAPSPTLGMLPAGCVNNGGAGAKGSPVVFQYTMHAAGLLRVSTNNPGTDMGLDTIVAVLANCSTTARALACNDDVGMGNLLSTATTTTALMAGQRVFVVVGGYGMDANSASTGVFELTVKETTPLAAGMPCTRLDVCATGTTCILSVADPTMGTCTMDGTQGGLCSTTGTACGTGLTCSVAMPTAAAPGYCRATAMAGADCDGAGRRIGCATGSACRPVPTMADASHHACVSDGTAGGVCRTAIPRCDTGLDCSADMPGLCQRAAAPGAACDRLGGTSACTMMSVCAPTSATAATCVTPIATPTGTHATPAARVAPVTHTTVYTGSLATSMDVNCYGVTVPMGASVFAETALPMTPACPMGGPDTIVTLYNPAGMDIAHNDDAPGRGLCSTIDPTTTTAAHGLAAGDYTVCISAFTPMTGMGMPVPNYTLTIGIEAP